MPLGTSHGSDRDAVEDVVGVVLKDAFKDGILGVLRQIFRMPLICCVPREKGGGGLAGQAPTQPLCKMHVPISCAMQDVLSTAFVGIDVCVQEVP